MKIKSPKIKRKGISTKAVREFLADSQWTKDEEATDFLDDVVYRHPDGRVVVIFSSGRGCLYITEQDFTQFVEEIKQLKSMRPTHILKDRLPYGEDFIQHVPELIDQLSTLLKIPRNKLDESMDSLTAVQAKIKHMGRAKCIEPPIFAALVAYIGEVMIAEIPNSRWQMRFSDQFPDTWEPWIVDSQERICNSWSNLYNMLAEPSEGISIQHGIATAITYRRVDVVSPNKTAVLIGTFEKQFKE